MKYFLLSAFSLAAFLGSSQSARADHDRCAPYRYRPRCDDRYERRFYDPSYSSGYVRRSYCDDGYQRRVIYYRPAHRYYYTEPSYCGSRRSSVLSFVFGF